MTTRSTMYLTIRHLVAAMTTVLLTAVATTACTDIIVGKQASTDGSVITSHTGAAPECRVHVVPAQSFPEGAQAPVYYGLAKPTPTSTRVIRR